MKEGKGTFGYNAATGEFGDMIEHGHSGSDQGHPSGSAERGLGVGAVATTEVMIAEAPKEEEHAMVAACRRAAWAEWTCKSIAAGVLLAGMGFRSQGPRGDMIRGAFSFGVPFA